MTAEWKNQRRHMNISNFLVDSAYQIVTWVCIALAIGGIWYFVSKESTRGIVWSAVALACSVAIMIGIIADRYFVHPISSESTPKVEQPKTVPGQRFQELREPTPAPRFHEKPPTEVSFSLGAGGATMTYSYARLLRGPMNPFKTLIPFPTPGFNPQFYIEDRKILMDIIVYDSILRSPIEIKRNQFVVQRPDWDKNSNDQALEVVNEKQIPVFQVIYKTESHIVLNGIFPHDGGLIVADEKGVNMVSTGIQPREYAPKRIFKYPSWQYPGQYQNE